MSVSAFSLIFLVRIRNKTKQNRTNVKICNLSDNLWAWKRNVITLPLLNMPFWWGSLKLNLRILTLWTWPSIIPMEITLGEQLTKCTGNCANNNGRRLEKGVEERGIFFVSLSTPLCLLCPSRFSCVGCIVWTRLWYQWGHLLKNWCHDMAPGI